MFTLGAYYQSVDPGNALTAINAVQDPHLSTSGVDIRVPDGVSNLIGGAALGNDASLARARITSPSLRIIAEPDIEPIVAALVFGSPPEASIWPLDPLPLEPGEDINLQLLSDPAAAQVHQGAVFLSDGPLQPLSGPMFSVRATSSITLSAGVWVNGNLTLATDLPVGRYRIVGMRARGTNLVFARLVIPGYMWRPGCPAVNALADLDHKEFRHGFLGSWGEFHTQQIPTVDCLGVTDTSQVYILDLMRV
jgi:hypothetical protein